MNKPQPAGIPATPHTRAAFPWMVETDGQLRPPADYQECCVCGCDHHYSPELARMTHLYYTPGTLFGRNEDDP